MKKKSRNIKNYRKIRVILLTAIYIFTIFAIASIGFILYNGYISLSQGDIISFSEWNTSIIVTPHTIGLDADRDNLNFGKSYPGGGGYRYFDINTTEEGRVHIVVTGDMENFLTLSDNNFAINTNTGKRVYVILAVPEDTPLGTYNGTIQVFVLKR